MTRLYWAIFGEIVRRHGLIDSSLPAEVREHLRGLATLSDRPSSDPPLGATATPYLSGFPYDRWYVLMRTFLDPTAARGGMVRSFCLLLPIDELGGMNDLSTLIDYLPATNSLPSEWNNWKVSDFDGKLRERVPADIASLIPLSKRLGFVDSLLRNHLPAVWTDSQDDFENVLVGIWALLPPAFRSILRFGRSYSPNDLGEPRPHFVTTPKNSTLRWDKETILKPLNREPESRAESFLLGDSSANSLRQFLSSLPVISEFRKLKLADDCLEAFEDANQGEISQAVEAAIFLNDLAPELNQARELKERTISTLENILQNAEIRDIRYFANLSLNSFANAEKRLGKLLTVLVNRNLKISNDMDFEYVEWAFNDRTASWWKHVVSNAIVEQVRNLSNNLARNLWNWWLNNPELVLHLKEHLPSHADSLMYETAPTEIDREKAHSILEAFSQNSNLQLNAFPRLVTYLQLKAKVSKDQILQTCLKRSDDVDIALNIFRKYIGARDFLDFALTVPDERVLKEAGACCFEDPILLNRIDPDNISWRKIWLVAIQSGADPLTGILQPNEVMATVLDEFLLGETVETNLLISLSYTCVANLIDYSSRSKIWSRLPLEAKRGFLEATSKGVFDRWRDDSTFQPELELTQCILKPGYFSEAVQQSDHGWSDMTSNYMAFLVSKEGSISNAEEVIRILYEKILTIPDIEIKQFAKWLRQNNWVESAEMAFEYYQRNPHSTIFYVLVEHTLEILPRLARLKAIVNLRRPTARIDFYSSLREVLSNLFPRGPNTDGFWEDVGGKPGALKVNGTVSEIWHSAINAVQQGKVPLDQVIRLAREQYPYNSELQELEHLSHKL